MEFELNINTLLIAGVFGFLAYQGRRILKSVDRQPVFEKEVVETYVNKEDCKEHREELKESLTP